MNKFKKIVFVFITVILLAGCDTNDISSSNTKEITDEVIVGTIRDNISSLDSLPKTQELYSKGSGELKDYTVEDKLLLSLGKASTSRASSALTEDQIKQIQAKKLSNIISVIGVEEVQNHAASIFGPTTLKHNSITSCPSYIYDETEKVYYVQTGCNNAADDSIISYLDQVSNKNNIYYATVYVGVLSNNKVFSDLSKSNVVKELDGNELYEITDETKTGFSKYTYTFTKNSNGDYVFTSLKKVSK